jgi:hypothetical protein
MMLARVHRRLDSADPADECQKPGRRTNSNANWKGLLLEVVQPLIGDGDGLLRVRLNAAIEGRQTTYISPADPVILSILTFARQYPNKVHKILVFAKACRHLTKLGIVISDYNRLCMFQHGIYVIHHES